MDVTRMTSIKSIDQAPTCLDSHTWHLTLMLVVANFANTK